MGSHSRGVSEGQDARGNRDPARLDGIGLGQYCTKLIQGPSMEWLIEHGYLAACDVYGPPTNVDLSQVHTRMGEYVVKELEGVMDKATITGTATDHYRNLPITSRPFVFV